MRLRVFLAVAISVAAFSSCTKKDPASQTGETATQEKPADGNAMLVARGKSMYMSNCIACHNADPKVDGVLGPSVHGSSMELLEARILQATYPPGYQPKRPTKTMVALPHLKNELNAIHAYVNQ